MSDPTPTAETDKRNPKEQEQEVVGTFDEEEMRFYEAACEGRVDDMQEILNNKPNFDINGLPTGHDHCDPYSFVQMAAANGHYDEVKLLLAHPTLTLTWEDGMGSRHSSWLVLPDTTELPDSSSGTQSSTLS